MATSTGACAVMRFADPDRLRVLEEIYDLYKDKVFGLAWKLTGDRQEAEDLTHDVFIRVHEHLDQFEGRSEMGTWIYRIATNLCFNRMRRMRRASFVEAIERTFGLVGREKPNDARLLEDETRAVVLEAVRELPPAFRACIALRDLEGFSYREIAEILQVPEGTVMSRLARGRERLRQKLSRLHRAGQP